MQIESTCVEDSSKQQNDSLAEILAGCTTTNQAITFLNQYFKTGSQSVKNIGKIGEEVASVYLRELGWEIQDRNWRPNNIGIRGEIDIVALTPSGELVAVEVKTRVSQLQGGANYAVNRRKLYQIKRLVGAWLYQRESNFPLVRVDLVALDYIDNNWQLTHIESVS